MQRFKWHKRGNKFEYTGAHFTHLSNHWHATVIISVDKNLKPFLHIGEPCHFSSSPHRRGILQTRQTGLPVMRGRNHPSRKSNTLTFSFRGGFFVRRFCELDSCCFCKVNASQCFLTFSDESCWKVWAGARRQILSDRRPETSEMCWIVFSFFFAVSFTCLPMTHSADNGCWSLTTLNNYSNQRDT